MKNTFNDLNYVVIIVYELYYYFFFFIDSELKHLSNYFNRNII